MHRSGDKGRCGNDEKANGKYRQLRGHADPSRRCTDSTQYEASHAIGPALMSAARLGPADIYPHRQAAQER